MVGAEEGGRGVAPDEADITWTSKVGKIIAQIWEFPRIRGTFLGLPIIRPIIKFGVYIGVPLFWETTKSLRSILLQGPR